ncbi:zinc finger protein OZF-like [Chrysoperla carnea]|uniref:zinc finger protein OZF-like n=1 Tax=Chrysoperla carnea TaxID=189513 RepID=UPI001D06DE9A|nr:zinc finger protein OZF-like [Chrysoperla carnea]
MITACASVQIWENDDLPNQICNECFLQLQNTINFKQLCENSDNTFRQIIEQNTNNFVKNEGLDDLNYPTFVKEESDSENVSNQNKDDSKKSKQNNFHDEELVEIKNEDKPELNRIKTRKKTIQYKFEEESDGCENDENDSNYDSESEKSELEEAPQTNDYKCETCSKSFKKVDALGVHMKKMHNAEGVKCEKCSLICYHPLHLRAHEKSHNKCRICNLTFSTRKKLTQHKLTHENDDIPEITCKMCSAKLPSKDSLYRHMRFIHKIEKIRKNPKCDKCEETFKTKRILEKHMRKMHPKIKTPFRDQLVNCEVCGKSLRRRNLRYHMTTHGERDKLNCQYCDKIFVSRETLTGHVQAYHTGSGPVYKHLCNQCGLKLRSTYHLNKHLLTHTKERPYACDKCEKTYRTVFQLKVHTSRIHLNERNFVCTFCSQAFFDKKILLHHVRRHTGEKPFKCHMCDKSFIQKVALNVHMKVHTNSI